MYEHLLYLIDGRLLHPSKQEIYSIPQDSVFTSQKTLCIFVTYNSCTIFYETQKHTTWKKSAILKIKTEIGILNTVLYWDKIPVL